ncbi:hypothetical protein [Bacillus rhizoplanae]|uniref:hypothetical protein n=1 Tax=Bacillus rhizoplanae TaxID=2880966 RepID=UPI003D2170C1
MVSWLVVIVLAVLIMFSSCSFYYYRKEKSKSTDKGLQITKSTEIAAVQEDLQIDKEIPIPWQFNKISGEYKGKDIPVNEELKSSIISMINMSKTEVLRNMGKGKEVYELVFTDEIKMELKKGTVHLMESTKNAAFKRGSVVDETGKIVSQAELKKMKIKPVQLKNLAFGVATVIVSQEHLQDIKQELSVLNSKIDNITGMMSNEYLGRAKGTYRYMKDSAYPLYNSHIWQDSNKIELERRYHQTIDDIETLLRNLELIKDNIGKVASKVFINYKSEYKEIEYISNEFNKFTEILEINFQNVVLLFKLRQLHGLDRKIEKNTMDSILELYDEFNEKKWGFHKRTNEFIEDFEIKFYLSKFEKQKKEQLAKNILVIKGEEKNKLRKLQSLNSPPDCIKIEILDGEIVGLKR